MNFKKRLKQAICVSAAVAVSFTSVLAESTPEPYVIDNYWIPPESYSIYHYFLVCGAKPAATKIEEYHRIEMSLVNDGVLTLNGDGTANMEISLDTITDENGNVISITETHDIEERLSSGYQNGTTASYINVPALTFKTKNTTVNYSTVSNKVECNKTGTYGTWTGNTAGTQGTITYPNYSCTYSPYSATDLDGFHLNTNNLSFQLTERQITGTDTVTGQNVINLDLNSSGTVTGTITFDLEGDINTNITGTVEEEIKHEWLYNMPWFDVSSFNDDTGIKLSDTFVNGGKRWDFYLCIASDGMGLQPRFEFIGSSQDEVGVATADIIYYERFTGYYLVTYKYTVRFNNYQDRIKLNFLSTKTRKYLPIYFGSGKNLSEEMSYITHIQSEENRLIEHGNDNSAVAVATAATTTNELDTTSTQLHNIDTGYLDQADNAIDALDTSSVDTLLSTNDFVATANWLSTQITNFLGVNNVFSTVVYFSLVLGIILVVLGRMR